MSLTSGSREPDREIVRDQADERYARLQEACENAIEVVCSSLSTANFRGAYPHLADNGALVARAQTRAADYFRQQTTALVNDKLVKQDVRSQLEKVVQVNERARLRRERHTGSAQPDPRDLPVQMAQFSPEDIVYYRLYQTKTEYLQSLQSRLREVQTQISAMRETCTAQQTELRNQLAELQSAP